MDTKKIVKAGVDRMTQEFSERIAEVGFKRYKKWFWTRLNQDHADFVHLHQQGSSYGGPINNSVSLRVHIGTRELNDGSEHLHLNGPCSDDSIYISDRYHLRFNAKSGSTFERCLDDLERFVLVIGEPWFSSYENQVFQKNTESVALTYKLLGIRGVKISKT